MNAGHLRARLQLAQPALDAAAAALWRTEGLRERCLDYLEAMHGVIRASVPLMRAAIHRGAGDLADDPVAVEVARWLVGHVAEENHHDAWLLEDLAAAGRFSASPLDISLDPLVARLVGAQYYWIEHHHPVALLGYIAVLEGNQPPPWLAADLMTRTGLPEAAFRTLQLHAELDQGHRAELDDLLDRLPLTARHQNAVSISALATVDAFTQLLTQVTHRATTRATGVLT